MPDVKTNYSHAPISADDLAHLTAFLTGRADGCVRVWGTHCVLTEDFHPSKKGGVRERVWLNHLPYDLEARCDNFFRSPMFGDKAERKVDLWVDAKGKNYALVGQVVLDSEATLYLLAVWGPQSTLDFEKMRLLVT